MRLSFGELELILRELHRVRPAGEVGLRSRLQFLVKSGFPPREREGRGRRVAYGVDEAFMMVVALDLTDAGVQPTQAMRLVLADWPKLRALVDAGLALEGDGDEPEPSTPRFAGFDARALAPLRAEADDPRPTVHALSASIVAAEALGGWRLGTSLVLVDVLARARQVARIVAGSSVAEAGTMDSNMGGEAWTRRNGRRRSATRR